MSPEKGLGSVSSYLTRRILYAFPILIGVNFITFVLFFVVNSPDDMARVHLGNRYVTEDAISNWKSERGYDKPLFIALNSTGKKIFTETIFFDKTVRLFTFDFGQSDSGRDISYDISERMWPSLFISLPVLCLGLLFTLSLALLIAFFRGTFFKVIPK